MGEGLPVAAFSWILRVGVTGGGGGFLLHCSELYCFSGILIACGFSIANLESLFVPVIQQTVSIYCVPRQQHSLSLGEGARSTILPGSPI